MPNEMNSAFGSMSAARIPQGVAEFCAQQFGDAVQPLVGRHDCEASRRRVVANRPVCVSTVLVRTDARAVPEVPPDHVAADGARLSSSGAV